MPQEMVQTQTSHQNARETNPPQNQSLSTNWQRDPSQTTNRKAKTHLKFNQITNLVEEWRKGTKATKEEGKEVEEECTSQEEENANQNRDERRETPKTNQRTTESKNQNIQKTPNQKIWLQR